MSNVGDDLFPKYFSIAAINAIMQLSSNIRFPKSKSTCRKIIFMV